LKKNILIILFFFLGIGVKILLKRDVNIANFSKEIKEHSGSKEYWGQRIGTFDSDDRFIKSIKKARKQIARMPKRRSLGLDWSELGPDNIGGRTRAILVDKESPNLIFAGGVAGGLWFSTDAGLTWSQTKPGDLAEVLTVNCITQDELGYIYYGTGEGVFYGDISESAPGTRGYGSRGMGVFRSIEPHGTSFMHLESSWLGKETATVSVNTISSDGLGNVYAGAKGKLYRTINQGIDWFEVNSTKDIGTISGNVYDVKALSDGSVIMAMGNDYYLSSNGDVNSFSKISNSSGVLTPATGRSVIAVAPSDENIIYISRSNSNDLFDGLFRSKDKGQTWEKIIGGGSTVFEPFGGQGNYNQCLVVFPDNPNKILLGGLEIYEWEEGQNWKKMSSWYAGWGDHDYVHADIHTFAFHPNNSDKYFIGTDGGVFVTKDKGEIYQRLNRGFNVTQFYGLAFGSDGVVLGGTQDNANIYIDFKGNTYQSGEIHNSGDGGYSAISQLMPNAFFVESQYGKIKRNNSRSSLYSEFFYHEDAASSSDNFEYDGRWSEFVTPFSLWESANDSLIPDTTVYISKGNLINGETITINSKITDLSFKYKLKEPVNKGDTLRLKVPTQSMFIYGTKQAVYISRNAIDFLTNPEWIELSTSGCFYSPYSYGFGPTCISVSRDGDVVYYGTSIGEVYRISNVSRAISNETIDSVVVTKIGDINKSGSSLNSFITDIAVDPDNKEHVLITVGFYDQTTNVYVSKTAASTDNESSFISVSGNLPQIPIYSALIEENTGVYLIGTEYGLFSSTNGGITWYQEFEGPPQCPVTMIRQQTFKGSQNRGQIYVATHGRGLFTSEHYSTQADQTSNSLNLNNELTVFPNPSFDRINFELQCKPNQEFLVQVVNLKGQLVFTRKQRSKFLNISELSEGRYILTIQTSDDFYSTQFLKK
jgi:photosystem II stability/assembly factor-like uncharacterized protein